MELIKVEFIDGSSQEFKPGKHGGLVWHVRRET